MIPLSNLKDHLRIPVDDTSEDALLIDYEAAAVAAIQGYTSRYFGLPELIEDETYDGDGSNVFWLLETPTPGELVVVEEWNGSGWADVATFEVSGFAVVRTDQSSWLAGTNNVRATYTRGYAPGDEPEAVRQAVRLQVADWYVNREAGESRVLSEAVKMLVGPYVKLRF